MSIKKLAWFATLLLGACTVQSAFAQPAGSGSGSAAQPADTGRPTAGQPATGSAQPAQPTGSATGSAAPTERRQPTAGSATPAQPTAGSATPTTGSAAPTDRQPTAGSATPTAGSATPIEPNDQPTPVEVAPPAGSGDTVVDPNKHEPITTDPDAKHAEDAHMAGAAEHSDEHHHPVIDHSKYINWADMGWSKKDAFGGPLGDGKMEATDVHGQHVVEDEEEKMSPPFIFMLFNFGLLLLILGKYGSPAAKKLAEERHDLIKNALDEAAKLRKQATDRLAEYESKLAKADAEIKALVEGMRADAENDKKRILAAAEAQAVQLKKDAELRIAAEIEYARAILAREVSAAATSATEKLLKEKTTADDQSKLVNAFITDVQHSAIRQGKTS